MATDRLINQTQGEDIIDQLQDIAANVGNITYGPQTTSDKVVAMTGYAKASTEAVISEGDTLNEAVGKLEKKADDALAGLDTKVVGPESSTTGAIATYSDATGNELANSGVTIATSTQGVTDSDTAVPTSKAVQAYNASTEHTYAFDTGTDNGTIKVTPSVGGVEGSAQSVAVKGLAGAAYKGVDTAPTASSTNLIESGGVYTALGNKLDATANAASAAKLNNGSSDYEVGTATKGVYFDDGIPKAMTYSVESNVPQNAVFTDTTYTKATNSAISVDNTNHTIDVATASTTTKGVVQLTNTLPASTATEDNKVPTALTVAQAIAALPEPMVFKGSVTGTYPSNPSVGDTYKATANSNSGVTPAYKSGDTVIYATGGWTVIPSGDEPSGTVTAVSVNGTQYDPGTGGVVSLPNYPDISGKIDTAGTGLAKDGTTLNHSNSISAKTTAAALKVKYDAQGHITGSSALSASDISAVPTSRTVNSKALSSNITLAGSDIALTGYSKGSSTAAVIATDTTNSAIAKHENRIDTNRANILYVEKQNGAKNLLKFDTIGVGTTISDSYVTGGVRFTRNVDNSITVTRESSNANNAYCVFILNSAYVTIDSLCDNDHYLIGCPTGGGSSSFELLAGTINARDYGSGVLLPTLSSGQSGIIPQIVVRSAFTGTVTFKPMIISKAAFNAGFTDYQPFALPNSDLTRLEAEDRAALAEEIDAGAKNKFDINGVYNADATLTISGNTITMTTDDTRTYLKLWCKMYNSSGTEIAYPIEPTDITANGVYNFPFTKTSNASYLRFGHNGATKDGKLSYKIDGLANGDYILQIKVINCTTTSGHLSWGDIMICTKAAFGVSQKFVSYKFPNPCKLYSDSSTTHSWCSFNMSQIPNGQYLLTVSGNDSVDNRKNPSLYVFSKYSSGTLYVLAAIKENTATTITSHSLSNDVLTLNFDALSYHGVSIVRLSGL